MDERLSRALEALPADILNPFARPRDGLQTAIAQPTSTENQGLDVALLEELKGGLALALHEIHRQRFLVSEIPPIDPERHFRAGGQLSGLVEVGLQASQILAVPGPELNVVAEHQVLRQRLIELMLIEDHPQVEPLSAWVEHLLQF